MISLCLTLFFANKDFNAKQIILGQYLGVIALILISALSYFLKFIIPVQWIGLLGILPILIGLKNLRELNKPHSDLPDIKGENRSTFYKLKNSNTFFVGSITIANGCDNIGVYVPIFATIHPNEASVIILIFMIMIGLWCLLSFKLVDNRILGDRIKKYGHIIFPFVLIFLGLSILIKSFLL